MATGILNFDFEFLSTALSKIQSFLEVVKSQISFYLSLCSLKVNSSPLSKYGIQKLRKAQYIHKQDCL